MCVKVVLMMELLYEEKTLTYEEEVRRFFFGESYETSNLLDNTTSTPRAYFIELVYFIYSQKKISLTKYLHAILLFFFFVYYFLIF